ncbi:MAG: alanine:cation symporter family protein [Ruminococcaceae bacterium]|nr:alanine:cation symporter family protein [Oscillospiraceae bacterium]
MAEIISSLLCGYLTPVLICIGGITLAGGIRITHILRPRRFIRVLSDTSEGGGTSPFCGLTMALAGTLGVGNITGVSAAVVSGGAGAVFWMWAGALLSMSIKYGEVALAVKYRREAKGEFYGGAMYYISDGLGRRFPGRSFALLGGVFALLCVLNSLVTGNIVQANSAAAVVHIIPRGVTGGILAVLVAFSAACGVNKIGRITSRLIPALTAVYMLLSIYVIGTNLTLIPEITGDIFRSAFSFRGVCGGAVGIGAREAVRFGITRGIFSNEAGCGTSPTAHASANTKSPFHQGCYGIFEVAADTLILCTMTAFVLLTADKRYGILSGGAGEGDAALTLDAFTLQTGEWVYGILAVSVLLFAYATIIAQLYYGFTALGYLTKKPMARGAYLAVSIACVFIGAVMRADAMWYLADITVCMMTVINIAVLLFLRKEIYQTVPREVKKAKKPLN